MAQAIACAVCQEVPEAHWMVTSRDEVTGVPAGTTFGLCVSCWVGMALSWLEEQQKAAEAAQEGAEAPPAALERVEADNGAVEVKPAPKPRKRAARTDSEIIHQDPVTETEAAHVDG